MNEGYKDPLQGTNGGIDLVAALFGPHLFLITQLTGIGDWVHVVLWKEKKRKISKRLNMQKKFPQFSSMWDMHAYAHSQQMEEYCRQKTGKKDDESSDSRAFRCE